MEQHIFCILIDYRGRHRKGVAIYNATYVNLQQKPWFHCKENVFFEHFRQVQKEIYIIFAVIFFF